jgi:Protein of unknown function (DUF4231)
MLKAVVIACAALIPLLSGLQVTPPWLTGSVGALIAVLEGLQQLNQYQQNWIRYRSTCESLKRESICIWRRLDRTPAFLMHTHF